MLPTRCRCISQYLMIEVEDIVTEWAPLPDLVRLGVDAMINKPITVAAFIEAFTHLLEGTDT